MAGIPIFWLDTQVFHRTRKVALHFWLPHLGPEVRPPMIDASTRPSWRRHAYLNYFWVEAPGPQKD
jgi:hypothetical protein